MGFKKHQVAECVAAMEKLAQGILNQSAQIKKIQAECEPHQFRFGWQVNAFHERIWHVGYECVGCGAEKVEKKEPVCEIHDLALVRCDTEDAEAEAERKKPEYQGYYNPPRAYRCPKDDCRKIHILWVNGD